MASVEMAMRLYHFLNATETGGFIPSDVPTQEQLEMARKISDPIVDITSNILGLFTTEVYDMYECGKYPEEEKGCGRPPEAHSCKTEILKLHSETVGSKEKSKGRILPKHRQAMKELCGKYFEASVGMYFDACARSWILNNENKVQLVSELTVDVQSLLLTTKHERLDKWTAKSLPELIGVFKLPICCTAVALYHLDFEILENALADYSQWSTGVSDFFGRFFGPSELPYNYSPGTAQYWKSNAVTPVLNCVVNAAYMMTTTENQTDPATFGIRFAILDTEYSVSYGACRTPSFFQNPDAADVINSVKEHLELVKISADFGNCTKAVDGIIYLTSELPPVQWRESKSVTVCETRWITMLNFAHKCQEKVLDMDRAVRQRYDIAVAKRVDDSSGDTPKGALISLIPSMADFTTYPTIGYWKPPVICAVRGSPGSTAPEFGTGCKLLNHLKAGEVFEFMTSVIDEFSKLSLSSTEQCADVVRDKWRQMRASDYDVPCRLCCEGFSKFALAAANRIRRIHTLWEKAGRLIGGVLPVEFVILCAINELNQERAQYSGKHAHPDEHAPVEVVPSFEGCVDADFAVVTEGSDVEPVPSCAQSLLPQLELDSWPLLWALTLYVFLDAPTGNQDVKLEQDFEEIRSHLLDDLVNIAKLHPTGSKCITDDVRSFMAVLLLLFAGLQYNPSMVYANYADTVADHYLIKSWSEHVNFDRSHHRERLSFMYKPRVL